jgi:hypothetical protein
MFARVTTGQRSPERGDEPRSPSDEVQAALARLAEEPGFKGTMFFLDRQTGKSLTIGLWETEADLRASLPGHQARLALSAANQAAPPVVETYELVGEVRPRQ